jgi:pimeloyl-ACP methyl ester carboxylesterase
MIGHATSEGMPQSLKDAYLQTNPDKDALYSMYKRDIARMQSFKDIRDEDIKAIRAPAFVMIGDEDVVRPEHAVELYRLLPHARLAILPGVHGEFIGELTAPRNPDLIAATVSMIEQFLAAPMPAAK